MVLMSFLAAGVGLLAGLIAFVLYKLIGLFTNLFFYHRFAADFISARHNQLGLWVIPIPVIGGIIVGFMAKYGTSKIKGHGIPEAMEAVMVNRSRIDAKSRDPETPDPRRLQLVPAGRSAPRDRLFRPEARSARWSAR